MDFTDMSETVLYSLARWEEKKKMRYTENVLFLKFFSFLQFSICLEIQEGFILFLFYLWTFSVFKKNVLFSSYSAKSISEQQQTPWSKYINTGISYE